MAITHKLHVPWNPEIGFGAVSWNNIVELNQNLANQLGITQSQIEEVVVEKKRVDQATQTPLWERRVPGS